MTVSPSRYWRQVSVAVLATVLATVLAVVGLTVVTAEPAAATTRWAGYRIKVTKNADSGWIGGRKLGTGKKVYRFQPLKANIDSGYKPARLTADLGGTKRAPSARITHRAAYVLAYYGSVNDDIQAAGVDAATYHFLKGGRWRIGKKRGSQRIRQSGANRSYVRSYARTMMANSTKYAGPYARTLNATSTSVGSSTKVTYRIKSAAGYGMANVPVRFTYPGTDPVTRYTDSTGTATAYFAVTTAGTTTVTARASRVPEWRLVVRPAKRTRASDVVRAGVFRTLTSAAPVTAVSGQSVAITNTATTLSVGQGLAGSYTITGGAGTRTVDRAVYGPFASTAGTCTGTPVYKSSVDITSDGTWPLPSYAAAKSGYYRWYVHAGANETSTEAFTCGDNVRVRKQATIGQFRPEGRTQNVNVGARFNVGARVAGFDRAEAHTITSRLYGPFAVKDNAGCVSSKLSKTVNRSITGNGDYAMGTVVVSSNANAGWYVWQSTLSSGDLILGGVSGCGVPYQVVK